MWRRVVAALVAIVLASSAASTAAAAAAALSAAAVWTVPSPARPDGDLDRRRSERNGMCFLRLPLAAGAAAAAAGRTPGGPRSSSIGPMQVVQVQYEQVDKRNFHGVLDRIREIGSQAMFWSLDTEFTGYKQSERDEFFDTLQQRYAKKKEVSEKYLVVQMGLSAFVWDPKLDDFRAHTWNIHVFPSAMVERIVACDASSLSFLREHGLDFNAWVDGVPFLALEQEASLRKQIEDQADFELRASVMGKRPTRSPLYPGADAETTALYNRLLQALDALGPGDAPFDMPEAMPWFRKKMVEQTVLRHPRRVNLWLEKVDDASPPASPSSLRVRYVTQEERAALVEAKKAAAMAELETAAGAMRILQVLKASGRPLVGHNFLLDLLFLYSHFVKPLLPETAMGFKTKFQRLFPDIYDTKVLAKALGVSDETGDTNLEGLFNSLSGGGGGGDMQDQGDGGATADAARSEMMGGDASAHEAGHDAFMTGVVFQSLLRHAAAAAAATASGSAEQGAAAPGIPGGLPSLTHAEPWLNKIFMRMSDIDTFELRNFKQIPDRSRVFHVRTQAGPDGTPTAQLQHRDLRDIFASVGPLQIRAMGKHEAFIVFQNTSDPPPETTTLKELAVARASESGGSVLEVASFEERRIELGHSW